MGNSQPTKPIEQVNVGDETVRSSWFGLIEHTAKVVDIDKDRRFAMVCEEYSDALFIMQLYWDGYNSKPGQRIPACCSCSTYLAAPVEKRHKMAWGWDWNTL